MTVGIVYLLTHVQLAARLVVSVNSLRRWYSGAVTVFTTRPESHHIGEFMAADPRLRIGHRNTEELAAENLYAAAYLTKAAFVAQSPYDATVFLDADTLVTGPINELLGRAQRGDLTVTIYGHLQTTDERLAETWNAWRRAFEESSDRDQWLRVINEVTTRSWPLVNAGVFAIRSAARRLLAEWLELTLIGRETRTPEEIALQLLLPRNDFQLLGCQFNCLPQVHPQMRDVRIWHFAGASHLNEEVCRRLWLPEYQRCLTDNVARLREWSSVAVEKTEKTDDTPFVT